MVDWEQIFKKYIMLVIRSEGTDFLFERDWSPEEWQAIKKLDEGATNKTRRIRI